MFKYKLMVLKKFGFWEKVHIVEHVQRRNKQKKILFSSSCKNTTLCPENVKALLTRSMFDYIKSVSPY